MILRKKSFVSTVAGAKNAVSLRSRLLAIIGISLIALWSAVAIWMVLDVRGELRATLDERLAASARMVAGLMSQLPSLPASAEGEKAVPLVLGRDGLECEVSLIRGEVAQTIAGTAGSPILSGAPLGYGTSLLGGKLWRTYVLQQGDIRIATADRLDVRERLLRDVALTAGIPFVVALFGSFLLLWFGIGRGLAPIERVRAVLAARQPADSAPLPETYPPAELRPLVDTIRNLLQRVHTTIIFERRFTDDAAHELRTPLTAVKTHLQVARLASTAPAGAEVMLQALSNADQGVLRLQRTLDQLLLLARLDSGTEQENGFCADALQAAQQAIADAQAGQALPGRIELEAPPIPLSVPLQETMLISALRNLLDNALRYGPPDAVVKLRIALCDPASIRFTVIDHGPGLNEEDCAQATQRFWRRGIASPGSGLGLSIVSAIARSSGGDLYLYPGIDGGLIAQITLPMSHA
jgi:two-component system sensor histidine kinase QseC